MKARLALVWLVALVACKARGEPAAAFSSLGADAQALREAFNADAGKVRLVVLVSPT